MVDEKLFLNILAVKIQKIILPETHDSLNSAIETKQLRVSFLQNKIFLIKILEN